MEVKKLKEFVQVDSKNNKKYTGDFFDENKHATKEFVNDKLQINQLDIDRRLETQKEDILNDTTKRIENYINFFIQNLHWKQSVNTYDDIETTYPTPEEGWTVSVNDTNITYRYDEKTKKWIDILSSTKNGYFEHELEDGSLTDKVYY